MAAAQVEGEAVMAWDGWVPTKKWISRRVKGVETVSVTPAQYYPGRRRKKKAIHARSAIDFSIGEPPWAIGSMQWRMETGRGRTRPGVGSYFMYVANCRTRQKSMALMVLSLGSGPPTVAKICPTERMYCSTLCLWIGLWLATRTPVWTL